MIPTMLEDLGFTDQDILRVLAAYAVYRDKGFEIRVVGSRASVTFVRGAKRVEGGKSLSTLPFAILRPTSADGLAVTSPSTDDMKTSNATTTKLESSLISSWSRLTYITGWILWLRN